MKRLNKLTAFSLAFVLLLTCLASCKSTPSVESYKATVTTSFTSNDADMADAIASLDKSSVTLYVYGDNLMVVSETALGDIKLNRTYTVADGILYNNTTLKAEGKTVNEKEKAAFAASEREALIGKVGAGAGLDILDFNNVVTTTGNFESYTCSDIKDDAKASLTAIFAAKFDDSALVNLTSAEYYLEMRDNLPLTYILNASFEVTMNSETYSVNMTIECDYNHSIQSPISAPSDVENYTETTYESIIG